MKTGYWLAICTGVAGVAGTVGVLFTPKQVERVAVTQDRHSPVMITHGAAPNPNDLPQLPPRELVPPAPVSLPPTLVPAPQLAIPMLPVVQNVVAMPPIEPVAPLAPVSHVVDTPKPTIDQLLKRLAQAKAQRAEIEKAERELIDQIKKEAAALNESLRKLGVGYDADPNIRMDQMINESEGKLGEPDHMTPERIHGGIM